MTGCHLSDDNTSGYKNRDAKSFTLAFHFSIAEINALGLFGGLPISRASEQGSAKVGGGYGALGWELLALMRSSGQGVNPSWPSFHVLPGW
jgi:hypothetical protein